MDRRALCRLAQSHDEMVDVIYSRRVTSLQLPPATTSPTEWREGAERCERET